MSRRSFPPSFPLSAQRRGACCLGAGGVDARDGDTELILIPGPGLRQAFRVSCPPRLPHGDTAFSVDPGDLSSPEPWPREEAPRCRGATGWSWLGSWRLAGGEVPWAGGTGSLSRQPESQHSSAPRGSLSARNPLHPGKKGVSHERTEWPGPPTSPLFPLRRRGQLGQLALRLHRKSTDCAELRMAVGTERGLTSEGCE